MKKLIEHINRLEPDERSNFLAECGTTEGYLRKLASAKQHPGAALCVRIEYARGSPITRRDLRPDDWHSIWPELRATKPHPQERQV